MIRRLIILLLIVGCGFAQADTTITKENNYRYFLETSGTTYSKIVDYEIINDEIKITKNGSTWQVYPKTQIKRITDLNRESIWEDADLIEQVNNANEKRLQKNRGRKYYHSYFHTDDEINNFSYQDNVKLKNMYLDYQDNKKYQPLGLLCSFYPFVGAYIGHIYTGNWKKGLLFGTAELVIPMIGGYYVMETTIKPIANDPDCNAECKNQRIKDEAYEVIPFSLIVLAPVAIHIWSMIEVYKDINKYNREIYKLIYGREPKSFSLNLQPTYKGANLTMSYAFN